MPIHSQSQTHGAEANEARIFRRSRPSDQARICEILADAKLSPRLVESSATAESTEVGSIVVQVCERAGKVVGLLQWRNLGEEVEVLDVAVAAKHRRQGNAGFLLEEFLRLIQEHGIRDVFLEVRESNLPAIALYRKFGFSTTGRRPNYYQQPDEAAILLRLNISG
jgi:tRNA threonylcarbamoyladenosine biosynthesis protein TsaB